MTPASFRFLELLRYIHRNPVRAGICQAVEDYRWSSHRGYLSAAKKWDWLGKQALLGMFSVKPGTAKKQYLAFVHKEDSLIITEFFEKKNLPPLLGSQDFIEWVKAKYYQLKKHHEIPQSHQLAPTIAEIKQAVIQSHAKRVGRGQVLRCNISLIPLQHDTTTTHRV